MKKYRNKSLRLPDFDYSQAGMYFITVCIKDMQCLLGNIQNSETVLSAAGKMVEEVFTNALFLDSKVNIDCYVVMPNHFHGVILLEEECGVSLSEIVWQFKSLTTHRYIKGVKEHGWPRFAGRLWGNNYYEHVIRNEADYLRIYEYIENNPAQWELDRFFKSTK